MLLLDENPYKKHRVQARARQDYHLLVHSTVLHMQLKFLVTPIVVMVQFYVTAAAPAPVRTSQPCPLVVTADTDPPPEPRGHE